MDNASIPNLFLDQDSSDVQLRIDTSNGDPKTVVPAHSLVLKTSSTVFRAMFDSANFKEGRTGVVELKVKGDLDDAIFFLRYLYTRELEHLDPDVYISLLQTAHLYDVHDLVKLCNERIVEAVTPLTVCRTYETLRIVASENLLDHCKDLMIQFAFLIFWKDLHLILDDETMSFLLGSDRLNLLDEDQALGALWRWGCTRRVLENQTDISTEQRIVKLLPLIREYFLEKVPIGSPWYGLLVPAKSDPMNATSTEGRRPDTKYKTIRFAEVFCVTKDIHGKRELTNAGENNTLLKFSVNRDILLAGFSICVSLQTKNLNVLGILLNNEAVVVHYHTRHLVSCTDTDGPYVYDLIIELKTPVLLRKSEFSLLSMNVTETLLPSLVNITNYTVSKDNSSMVQRDNGIKFSYTDDRAAVSRLYCFV